MYLTHSVNSKQPPLQSGLIASVEKGNIYFQQDVVLHVCHLYKDKPECNIIDMHFIISQTKTVSAQKSLVHAH